MLADMLADLSFSFFGWLACLFGWHEKAFWSDELCDEKRVMAGMCRPWDCPRCGHQSHIFFYPPCPPRPGTEDRGTCQGLELIAERTPFPLHEIESACKRLGSYAATVDAVGLALEQDLSLAEAAERTKATQPC